MSSKVTKHILIISVPQQRTLDPQDYQRKPTIKPSQKQDKTSTVSNRAPMSCAKSTAKQSLRFHNKYAALTVASY